MGASGGASASNTSTSGKSDQQMRQVYDDPRAQVGLNALTKQAGGVGADPNASALASFYKGQMGAGGAQNPYLESTIGANNQVANKTYGDRSAQIRSAGFRGGMGRDVVNQGQMANDFTNQQFANNQNMRMQDYTQRQGQALGAGNSLQQMLQNASGQQGASATTLLQALRGQSDIGKTSSSSTTISGGGSI